MRIISPLNKALAILLLIGNLGLALATVDSYDKAHDNSINVLAGALPMQLLKPIPAHLKAVRAAPHRDPLPKRKPSTNDKRSI